MMILVACGGASGITTNVNFADLESNLENISLSTSQNVGTQGIDEVEQAIGKVIQSFVDQHVRLYNKSIKYKGDLMETAQCAVAGENGQTTILGSMEFVGNIADELYI